MWKASIQLTAMMGLMWETKNQKTDQWYFLTIEQHAILAVKVITVLVS